MSNPAAELLLFADEFGVLVQGPEDAASAAIEQLLQGTDPGPGARRRLSATEAAAVGASGLAVVASSGEYLRLTTESAAKVKQFGEQFDQTGAMRGWVKDGNKFAGQLAFEPVSMAAEQALALQTAAVSLALKSAIADVQKAVEEVADKVDDIRKQMRARLQGDVDRHLPPPPRGGGSDDPARPASRGRLGQRCWRPQPAPPRPRHPAQLRAR